MVLAASSVFISMKAWQGKSMSRAQTPEALLGMGAHTAEAGT